ncbi:MAG: type II toxin-antitoxin system VapC family toxin [Sphingomonadales bacterium]|nr:type II toxin-antitoxin system VapC family toxin [Sphingomonadales bacterium]
MMRYLLDTNSLIAWTARKNEEMQRRMADNRGRVVLSSIVLYELYFGAFNSDKIDRNLREIDGFGIPTLDFDRADARAAGEIRATLRKAGAMIGPYDTLIAGQALARDLILVTNNTREFARVAGLRVEDWTTA